VGERDELPRERGASAWIWAFGVVVIAVLILARLALMEYGVN